MTWQYDLKAIGTISGSHTAAATAINLETGDGNRFTKSPRKLVIWDALRWQSPAEALNDNRAEIAYQTVDATANQLPTVSRGREGTTALDMTDVRRVYMVANFLDHRVSNAVDVQSFGATGDGTTDDTQAFLDALDSLMDGGTLFVPAAAVDYNLATWPTAGKTYTKAITILGEGAQSIIDGPVGALFIEIGDTIEFRDVVLQNWDTAATLDTLTVTVDRVVFDNVRFQGVSKGLTWVNLQVGGILKGLRIHGCEFDNLSDVGVDIRGEMDHVSIVNNHVLACKDHAFKVGKPDNAAQDDFRHTEISGNTIENVTATSATIAAIAVYGRDATIMGNVIEDVSGASSQTFGIYTECRRATITGNVLVDVDGAAGTAGVGINVQGSARGESASTQGYSVVVADNVVDMEDRADSTGIILGNDDVLCTGNLVERFQVNGIATDASAHDNIMIIGNRLRVVTTGSSKGVRLVAQGNHFKVAANMIEDANTAIEVVPAGGTPKDIAILGNTLRDGTWGIRFNASVVCDYVQVKDNYIEGFTTRGISWEGTAPANGWVDGNLFNGNTADIAGGSTPTNSYILVTDGVDKVIHEKQLQIDTGGLKVVAGGIDVDAGGATIAGGVTVEDSGLTVTAGGATVTAGGLDVDAGGATIAGGVTVEDTALTIFTGGPDIRSGTGAPVHTPVDGSIYLRTDGGASSTLYVRDGTWRTASLS